MNGKGGKALGWAAIEIGGLKTLERGVAHHMGKGMMMEIIHSFSHAFFLSLFVAIMA